MGVAVGVAVTVGVLVGANVAVGARGVGVGSSVDVAVGSGVGSSSGTRTDTNHSPALAMVKAMRTIVAITSCRDRTVACSRTYPYEVDRALRRSWNR
jgi:hypothetical protein